MNDCYVCVGTGQPMCKFVLSACREANTEKQEENKMCLRPDKQMCISYKKII